MKKQGIPQRFTSLLAFVASTLLVLFFASNVFAQKVVEPTYDRAKFPNYEAAKKATPRAAESSASQSVQRNNAASLAALTTCGASYIPKDASYTPVPRNDDGSLGPINLGWTFNFCGNSYNQVYINTNGNLTFTAPLATFTPSGFPITTPMVAAFWSDIDTRNTACGQVWYKLTSHYLIVTWDHTGYFANHCDKTVSFNLIISDGTIAGGLGLGYTMQFIYGDMQFTTGDASGGSGGFGGGPATVGFNSGNGTNFEQVGRFDHPGTDYDGPFGANDGVDYLDNKCFKFKSNNPPIAVCKNASLMLGSSGTVSLSPSAIDNGSLDDCGPVTLSVSPSTLTCSNIGTNVVMLTVTDNLGQTATCNSVVTVADNLPPTILCKNATINLNSAGNAAITPSMVSLSGGDNCGILNLVSVTPTNFNCSNLGPNTVTLTVNDGHGNTNSCTATVTVVDNMPPVLVCKNATANLDAGGSASITTSDVFQSGSDNCGTVNQVSVVPNSFTCSNIGPNTVTLTVNDGHGNIATCNAMVTVQDLIPLTMTCPANIVTSNMLNFCGAVVNYPLPVVTDNCPFTLTGGPASGSFFPVGVTTVTYVATDASNHTLSCTFSITVNDTQKPDITCPGNVTVSCEDPIKPQDVGQASASDNCAIASIVNTDVKIPGTCTFDYTVNRTWLATDVHANTNSCLQVIKVEDKKPPVITCPPNVTVTCDTAAAQTGLATATDNCDQSVSISHQNFHISGDCEWFCITERHWKATDDCLNTSKCVQVITKDVTPLIQQALAAGPLVWGQPAATVTLPQSQAACVVQWLPYTGVVPTALKFDDAVAGPSCTLMTNPLSGGHIVNPLLGEAMKLKFLVRLNPALGTTKLSAIPCPMHFIVKQALAPDPDVNELLRVTDLTLGNVNANLLVPQHTIYLLDVLKCVNAGHTVCNP